MRSKLIALCVLIACGSVFVMMSGQTTASAGNGAAALAVSTASSWVGPTGEEESKFTYVGSKKCKTCHKKQHSTWLKTEMKNAFNTLKPGEAKEAKEKFKLDPAKDYTKDATCLKCHTTGYGAPGGYAIPDAKDPKLVKAAKAHEGVGCESCHGPGSEYMKVFMDIFKKKRTYDVEELYQAGLKKVDKKTCLSCHNDSSPTLDKDSPFDYEKQKDAGTHEHEALKQRKG